MVGKRTKPQIILSSSSKRHLYSVALALQREEALARFITTIYIGSCGRRLLGFLADKWPIGSVNQRLLTRSKRGLNDGLILSLWLPEILQRLLSLIPLYLPHKMANMVKDVAFDVLASGLVQQADVLQGWTGCSLRTLRVAKKKGMLAVLDQGAQHPKYRMGLLREEYYKYGISFHPDPLLTRREQEYEVADYILVPSLQVRDTFLREGINAEKLKVIPYGVDVEQFTPSPREEETFRILCVSALSLEKGTHYLLEAFRRLNLPNCELVLIGKCLPSFASILREYQGLFTHIKYVPHYKINKYYANSTIFVLPSLSEGSALAVYEAMACGLPVIVTEACGSIARDGIDGIVIPIRSTEAIIESIKFLYHRRSLLNKMARNARKRAEKYTWECYAKNVITFYQGALGV